MRIREALKNKHFENSHQLRYVYTDMSDSRLLNYLFHFGVSTYKFDSVCQPILFILAVNLYFLSLLSTYIL